MRFIKAVARAFLFTGLIAGCAPAQPVSSAHSNQSQDGLATIIAGTAAAAQTSTARALPTATQTPIPTKTASLTPTVTPTFLFLLPSDTPAPLVLSNPASSGDDDSESPSFITPRPWKCEGLGQTPPDWTVFKPGAKFSVYWSVKNIGTELWTINTVDFVYKAGYQNDNTKIQDFPKNASTGSSVTVRADFTAPKQQGEYKTYFVFKVGRREFCGMKLIFVVGGK